MDEIYKRISFGTVRINNEKLRNTAIIDRIDMAIFKPQRKMLDLAANQLGTVGSGNHFIDLFKGEDDYLWIGVHFGSRGFGHKTAMGFIALSQGLGFTDKAKEGPMDGKPILLDRDSPLGWDYFDAMTLAGEYAYAGRDAVVDKVLEILGNPKVDFKVHNHHNFAWEEDHYGESYMVVRKGCTPAFPGQYGFIGANMLDESVIIQGLDSVNAKEGLYSTVHGAGRIMSRTAAAGKTKWIRDDNGNKIKTQVSKGSVNFESVKESMSYSNVVLRGAGPDEAPECYKSLGDVLQYQGVNDTIEIKHILTPIGVAMAGDEFDPYKD